MAKIVKPKLTNAVSNIKIDSFNYSNNSKIKKANLITDINNTITDYLENNHQEYTGKIVSPNLNNILKDGSIESFLQQFHIFDFNETTEQAAPTPAPTQDSSNDSGSSSSSEPKNDTQNDDIKNKSVDELAREVLKGKYGTGQARKDALGDRYDEVQKRVEELIKNPSGSSSSSDGSSSSQTNIDSGKEPEKRPDSQPKQESKPKEEQKPKEESKPAGNGKTTEIPGNIRQTGIISNYTQNYGTRGWAYNQGKLASAYKAAGSPADGNMATINGRYMVAVSPRFGKVGDNIDIQLANGKVIHAVIADVKGSDATSSWGHELGGAVDVVEWEINGTSQSQLTSNLKNKGWYGSKVTSITNTGSGHYF